MLDDHAGAASSMSAKPTLRWGILGAGSISSTFVSDLILPRTFALAHHIITALGTSSKSKGEAFIQKCCSKAPPSTPRPKIYTSYSDVYAATDVDVVYIGTPHSVHKENCLDAIAAGKHILCEKPFMVNARDSAEVFAAAKDKGVYVMEAVWTRFFPLIRELQARLHDAEDPLLGTLYRCWCDLGVKFDWDTLPPDSRLRDKNLGAGALLDMGIYPITLARVLLGGPFERQSCAEAEENLVISSELVLNDEGIDVMDSVILHYTNPPRLATLTTSMYSQTPSAFMRIEGSKGNLVIEGHGASFPLRAIITLDGHEDKPEVFEPKHEGMGYYFEADAVALDLKKGRLENEIVPHRETMAVMRLMDGVRKRAGLRYPQDGDES